MCGELAGYYMYELALPYFDQGARPYPSNLDLKMYVVADKNNKNFSFTKIHSMCCNCAVERVSK